MAQLIFTFSKGMVAADVSKGHAWTASTKGRAPHVSNTRGDRSIMDRVHSGDRPRGHALDGPDQLRPIGRPSGAVSRLEI